MRLALVLAAAAGCHVTVRTELSRTVSSRAEPILGQARAEPPTIVLADGALRFVEPLVCPSEQIAEVEPEIQRRREANLATFVVGLVAVAGGAIAAFSGLAGDDPGASPLTYGGGVLVAGGLPFTVGPWLGNGTSHEPRPTRTERRPGGDVPCGARGVHAVFAVLTIGDREIYGGVADDGTFQTSPFSWTDAFDPTGGPAFAVRAELGGDGTRRLIDKVFDAGALAPLRDRFLASTHLDVGVEPLRAVPRVTIGTPRVGHVLIGGVAALHVVVPVTNAGPGDAWQVRATLGATSPELDGRLLYLGHIAPQGSVSGEAWIALSQRAEETVRTGTIALSIRLADAHQTMPSGATRFVVPIGDEGFQ